MRHACKMMGVWVHSNEHYVQLRCECKFAHVEMGQCTDMRIDTGVDHITLKWHFWPD